MCENVFRNKEEEKRKEEFSKLFALLVSNKAIPEKRERRQTIRKETVCP